MIIIKSQDGKSIREYIGVNINYRTDSQIIGQSKGDVLILESGEDIVESSGYPLGVYNSKKRVKEVMEEIEKHIEGSNYYTGKEDNWTFTKHIFKMPKE